MIAMVIQVPENATEKLSAVVSEMDGLVGQKSNKKIPAKQKLLDEIKARA